MRTKTTVKRAIALLLSTLGIAVSTGVAVAPAAHAAVPCPSSYACLYQDNGLAGIAVVYKSAGNASPNVAMTTPDGGFVWNHGRSSELQVTTRYGDGRRYVFCLTHGDNLIFADGDTDSPTYRTVGIGDTVVSWTWRSSRCPTAYYREGVIILP